MNRKRINSQLQFIFNEKKKKKTGTFFTSFVRLTHNRNTQRSASGSIERRYLDAVIPEGLQSVQDGFDYIADFLRFRPEDGHVVCQQLERFTSHGRLDLVNEPEALDDSVMRCWSRMSPGQLDSVGG